MKEPGESEIKSRKRKLLNLCRTLIGVDKVKVETTKPIRKWLKENGDLVPGAEVGTMIANSLERQYSESGKKTTADLQKTLDKLVSWCEGFVEESVKDKLDEKPGINAVRSVTRVRYVLIGCLVYIVFTGLMYMMFMGSGDDPIVPRLLFLPIPLVAVFAICVFFSLYLASLEVKSYRRMLVKIQVGKREKYVGAWVWIRALFDILSTNEDSYESEGQVERQRKRDKKHGRLVIVPSYSVKIDADEIRRIPNSIGEKFKNNDIVMCGVTTSLFSKKKNLWKPFERV